MRAVKDGSGSVEQKPDARAIAFIPLGSHGHEERLNVFPGDVGPNRIGKDGFQGLAVFAVHIYLVSQLDTIGKLVFLMQFAGILVLKKSQAAGRVRP